MTSHPPVHLLVGSAAAKDPRFPALSAVVDDRVVASIRLRQVEDPEQRNRFTVNAEIDSTASAAVVEQVLGAVKGFARARGAELLVGADLRIELIPSFSVRGPNGRERRVGPGHPVFIIAEAGSNWRMGTPARDRRMAEALIDVAVAAGCDAVKFQTYRPETVYVENAGTSDYLSGAGIKESIRDIFADLAMPYEMIPELASYCEKRGILFMSTPFSATDFEALDPFVPMHKLASYEISHRRLIEKMAASGKPVIMSTGASTLEDAAWALGHFRAHGGRDVALLQCTARYPAPLDALNLETIPLMRSTFGVPVGLSDHSREALTGPVVATALGATIIEKHYTLDQRLPGPDHAFAINPDELTALVGAVRAAQASRGSGLKQVLNAEDELRSFARRGLQATKEIRKGDVLIEGKNFDILRPGKRSQGAHSRDLELVAGGRAVRDIALGEGIFPNDIERDA